MSAHLDRQIARASGTLMLGNALTLLLGVANTLVIATYFGTSPEMDAYALARVIPDAAWVLFSLMIARVYLPLFTSCLSDRSALSRLLSSAVNLLLGISGLMMLIICLLAPWLISTLVNASRPHVRELVIHFCQLLSITFVLSAVYQVWSAFLQAQKRFLAPALAQSTGRLVMLIVVIGGAPFLGIYALICGVIAYYIVMLVTVIFTTIGQVDYQVLVSPNHAWQVSRHLVLPLLLLSVLERLHDMLLRVVAAGLPTGSLAALDYATAILALLLTLLNTAMMQAIFPFISELVRQEAKAELVRTVNTWLRVATVVILPVSIWVTLMRVPIVLLLFHRGAFNQHSVNLTSDVLAFFLLSLLPLALGSLLELVFLSSSRLRWCLRIRCVGVCVSLLSVYLLSRHLGVRGIGAGFTIGMTVQCMVTLVLANKVVPLQVRDLLVTSIKVLVCTGLACLAPWYWFSDEGHLITQWLLPAMLMSLGLSCGIYLVTAQLLRVQELEAVWKAIHGRLNR